MTLLKSYIFYSMPVSTAVVLFIVLGLIYVYTAGNETRKLREIVNGIFVTIAVIIVGWVIWSHYDERVNTPNYVVDGEIDKWDWRNIGTTYYADGKRMNITIDKDEIDSLPNPKKLKEIFDGVILNLEKENKGFKLKHGTFYYKRNEQYSFIKNIPENTLDLKIRYSSIEGKEVWDWDGKKYVKTKIPSDNVVKVFKFDNKTLKIVKIETPI